MEINEVIIKLIDMRDSLGVKELEISVGDKTTGELQFSVMPDEKVLIIPLDERPY